MGWPLPIKSPLSCELLCISYHISCCYTLGVQSPSQRTIHYGVWFCRVCLPSARRGCSFPALPWVTFRSPPNPIHHSPTINVLIRSSLLLKVVVECPHGPPSIALMISLLPINLWIWAPLPCSIEFQIQCFISFSNPYQHSFSTASSRQST